MPADGGARFNVQLDEHHARKLRSLAERTHMNPGTLARAKQGLREIEAGQGIPLDELTSSLALATGHPRPHSGAGQRPG